MKKLTSNKAGSIKNSTPTVWIRRSARFDKFFVKKRKKGLVFSALFCYKYFIRFSDGIFFLIWGRSIRPKRNCPCGQFFLCKIRHNFGQEEGRLVQRIFLGAELLIKKTAAEAAVFSTIFVYCRSSRKMIADTIASAGRSRRQLLNISFMPNSG